MNLLHIRARQFSSYCFWTGAPGEWVCATALYQWNLSFLQPFGSPGHKPTGFSKPAGLGVQFSSGDPKGWGSSCGSPGPHSSGRNSTFVRALLIEGHHMEGGYFIEIMSLLLLPMFNFLLWRSCSARVKVHFRETCFICSWGFGVSLGGSEFWNPIHCHIELFPPNKYLSDMFSSFNKSIYSSSPLKTLKIHEKNTTFT